MNEFQKRCKGLCPICECHLSCVLVDLTAALTHVLRRGVGTRWGQADLGRSPPAGVGFSRGFLGPILLPSPFLGSGTFPSSSCCCRHQCGVKDVGRKGPEDQQGFSEIKDIWAFPYLEAPALL